MCKSGGGSAPAPPVLPPPPDAPTLPAFPNFSPEELSAFEKQGLTLDTIQEILAGERASSKETRDLLQGITGLFNEDGSVNQQRITDLQGRVQSAVDLRTAISQQALGVLGGFLDQGPSAYDGTNDAIGEAEQQRYLRALRGEIPASEGLEEERRTQFEIFKEAAGQRGIRIDGDSPETATSESTAGIRLLGEFNKRYDLARESERRTELELGSARNLNRIGLLADIQNQRFGQASTLVQDPSQQYASNIGLLSLATEMGEGRLAPQYLGLLGAQGALSAPYTQQRLGQYENELSQTELNYQAKLGAYSTANQNALNAYNAAVQNYQARQQSRAGLFGSLGQLGGTAGTAMLFNPATMPYGVATLGGTALLGLLGR